MASEYSEVLGWPREGLKPASQGFGFRSLASRAFRRFRVFLNSHRSSGSSATTEPMLQPPLIAEERISWKRVAPSGLNRSNLCLTCFIIPSCFGRSSKHMRATCNHFQKRLENRKGFQQERPYPRLQSVTTCCPALRAVPGRKRPHDHGTGLFRLQGFMSQTASVLQSFEPASSSSKHEICFGDFLQDLLLTHSIIASCKQGHANRDSPWGSAACHNSSRLTFFSLDTKSSLDSRGLNRCD